MFPIMFRPGQQIKRFAILRKRPSFSKTGRVGYSTEEEPVGTMEGSISQASQKEVERWGQIGHPITHTVTVQGITVAQPEDVLVLNGRFFYIEGKDNPAEMGVFSILYCKERMGTQKPAPPEKEGESR